MLRFTLTLLLSPLPLAAAEKTTYEDHVFPIFEQSCLNCHNPDKAKGGLDLSNFSGAMKGGSGGKVAEAGDTGSKLIAVVLQTSEPKMPPEGDKLSDEQIDILKAWVEGGLLETRNSKARKPSKPKFDLTMSSDPAAKPDGPPPMPEHVTLEPEIVTRRSSAVHAMAASPWAPLVAVTGQRQVLLFHSGDHQLVGVLPFPEGDPVSLAFTPNGRYLIVGGGIPGKSGLTVTYDVTTGTRILTAAKEFDTVLAADLRPDLGTVATGSPSRLVKLWKTEDGSQTASIKKHTDWVTALDFSPDGILLATGGRGGGVWVWEAGSGAEFHTLRGHQAGITATAFRGDSNVLGSASEDGSVRFWEMSSGREIKKIDAHPGGVVGMAWGRDGSLATIGRDHKAKLWKPDFNQLREIKDLPELPTAVALDAESTTLFVADYRGVITSYSVESGEKTGGFDANPPAIATRLAALQAELDAHPSEVEAAEKPRDEANRALKAARQHVAEAEAAVNDAKNRQQEAERQIAETRKKEKQLRDEVGRRRDELGQHQNEIAKLRAAIDQRISALADLDPEIDSARRESESAASRLAAAEKEDDASEIEAARKETERWDGELASLTAKRDDESAALEPLNSRLAELDRQAAALDETIKSHETELQTVPGLVKTAAAACDQAKKAIPEAEKQLAETRKAVPPAEEQLKQAEAALAGIRDQRAGIEQRLAHWRAADLNARSIRVAKQAAILAEENEILAAEFADLSHGVETKSAELNARRKDLQTALADIEAAVDDKAHSRIEALNKEIERMAAGLERHEQRMQEVRRELDARLPEANRLEAEAADLKRRYLES